MKQGASSYNVSDWKTEPKSKVVHPTAAGQIGSALAYKGDELINGRGFHAPAPAGKQVHKSGSQGRHK